MKTPALKFASARQSASDHQQHQIPGSQDQGNFIPIQFQSQQQQQQQAPEISDTPGFTPSQQDIELAAYELYSGSGFEEGRSLEHWLEAERRLQSRPQSSIL
ncbi:MAG: DUF2934 domain-containing protein [Verrucomicrobiota bacterium]